MEYFVAKSYENCERVSEPYTNSKGKMAVKVKAPCKRCGGSGHYSYNSLDGTRCYGCGGRGYNVSEVRAYTEKERASLDRAAARRVEKKNQEKEEKLQFNISNRNELMEAWFQKNGFNEDGITYVVTGDSYSIKEELKEAGFKFEPTLKWHGPAPAGFDTFELKFDDVFTWNDTYATANFIEDPWSVLEAKKKLAEISLADGDFIGEVKERLRNLTLSLVSRYKSENYYGVSECLNFKDDDNHNFCWWTGTLPKIEVGEKVIVTGTVKEHSTYNGKKITVLTRCKIEKKEAV